MRRTEALKLGRGIVLLFARDRGRRGRAASSRHLLGPGRWVLAFSRSGPCGLYRTRPLCLWHSHMCTCSSSSWMRLRWRSDLGCIVPSFARLQEPHTDISAWPGDDDQGKARSMERRRDIAMRCLVEISGHYAPREPCRSRELHMGCLGIIGLSDAPWGSLHRRKFTHGQIYTRCGLRDLILRTSR